jgi:hypothetical protein
MDNNQDKNVYQYPASQSGEVFDGPLVMESAELTEEESRQKFVEIEREYVRDTFNQMTQDLEMSLLGYEKPIQPTVELMSPDPIATELLQIGAELMELRQKHVDTYTESDAARRWFAKAFSVLMGRKS